VFWKKKIHTGVHIALCIIFFTIDKSLANCLQIRRQTISVTMKKMKFILVGLAIATSSFVYAQSAQIRAGINLANVSVNDNGRVDKANQLTSFQVGVIGDFTLVPKVLSLQPGILYTGKGSKVEKGTQGSNAYYKQTFNPQYIEIPANLVFKAPIGLTSKFFVGTGPYLGIGVGGKTTTDKTVFAVSSHTERSITFSNDDPTTFNQEEGTGLGVIRRFDYGVNGTAGFETKSLVLGVNYGLGLAKLQSGTNNNTDNNNKNRVLSLTLGFKI